MKRVIDFRIGALSRLLLGSLVLLALGVTGSSKAYAYGWRTCDNNPIIWSNHWTNMSINTVSFPVGSVWDAQLQDAMWHWNNVKGSDFQYFFLRDTDGTFSHGDGVNEVYFSGPDDNDTSALAVTHTRYHCYWLFGWQYGIDETDISFNTAYSWSLSPYDYGNPTGSPYTFESVALHELGHALGLGHEDRGLATMNSYYPNSGPLGYYKEWDPLPDDRQGARFLYPDGTTEVDVAGSALKHTGSGTSDLVSSTTIANLGDTVDLEFTFHNMGTATQSFDIDFYLSTNDFISTFDRWLGRNYGAWGGAGASGTYTRSLVIPKDIAPGTYYLGFLLDPDNSVPEGNENNNIQPMPRTIVVLPDTTLPSVSLTAPTSGQILSGTIAVQANAFDNIAVARVDFYVDATFVGSDSFGPYDVSWSTLNVGNGSHTFRAIAVDTAGNTASSSVIATVNNPSAMTIFDVSKLEGNAGLTPFSFRVDMSPARAETVTVRYATANGSALSGSDYTATSGVLTFLPGQTSKTVTVSVRGDTAVELDENFFVSLSNVSNAGVTITRAKGTGLIINDDQPSLRISDVTLGEGNSGSTPFNFIVTLTPASTSTVTVNYATANGSALAGSDYTALAPATLTFAPGETSKTLTVKVIGDTTVESNETFFVNLSGSTGAKIADGQGRGTILNDDGPVLSISDFTKAEGQSGSSAFTFKVTLSRAAAVPVTVKYATSNDTALAGSDYVAVPLTTLTFAPGQTAKTITVSVMGDKTVERNELFNVNLSQSVGASIFKGRGVGTILNDD